MGRIKLIRNAFPHIRFVREAPNRTTYNNYNKFQDNRTVRRSVFHVVIMRRRFIHTFQRNSPSSFVKRVTLCALSITNVSLSACSINQDEARVFVIMLPILFPRFFPIVNMDAFPFLFPIKERVRLRKGAVLIIIMARIFPTTHKGRYRSYGHGPRRNVS